jgi:hypothetical protein
MATCEAMDSATRGLSAKRKEAETEEGDRHITGGASGHVDRHQRRVDSAGRRQHGDRSWRPSPLTPRHSGTKTREERAHGCLGKLSLD